MGLQGAGDQVDPAGREDLHLVALLHLEITLPHPEAAKETLALKTGPLGTAMEPLGVPGTLEQQVTMGPHHHHRHHYHHHHHHHHQQVTMGLLPAILREGPRVRGLSGQGTGGGTREDLKRATSLSSSATRKRLVKQLELRSLDKGDEHERTILVRPKSIL